MTITPDGDEGSTLPPSQRDLRRGEDFVRAHSRNLRSLGQGFTTGRMVTPRAVTGIADSEDDSVVSDDGSPADDTQYEWEWGDRFTVTSPTGNQVATLTYVPVDESLFVFWHPAGGGGLPITNEHFTLVDNIVTLYDPGILAVGDEFSFQYMMDPGIIPEPEPGLIELMQSRLPIWLGVQDDPSGLVLTDYSGYGRDGTYDNGVTLGAPSFIPNLPDRTSATYDGIDNVGGTGYGAWLNTTGIAICAFVDPTATVTGLHQMICGRTNFATFESFAFYITPTGKLEFQVVNGMAGPPTVTGLTTLSPGPLCLGALYNDVTGDLKVFLNGVQDGATTTSGPLTTSISQGAQIMGGGNTGVSLQWLMAGGSSVVGLFDPQVGGFVESDFAAFYAQSLVVPS